MKKTLVAIGKAVLYILFTVLIQFVVSFAHCVISGVIFTAQYPDLFSRNPEAVLSNFFYEYAESPQGTVLLISNAIALLLIWLFFVIRRRKFTQEVELVKTRWTNLATAVVYGFGMCFSVSFVTWLLVEILPISQATIDAHLAAAALVDSDYTITGILSTVVIAPIAEEVFLRGLAYTRLRRAMPPILAAVLSSLAFGLLHGDIIWFMSAFGSGLAMAWIFQRTGSLWASILVHMTNNALAMLVPDMAEGWGYYALVAVSLAALAGSVIYLQKTNPKPHTA